MLLSRLTAWKHEIRVDDIFQLNIDATPSPSSYISACFFLLKTWERLHLVLPCEGTRRTSIALICFFLRSLCTEIKKTFVFTHLLNSGYGTIRLISTSRALSEHKKLERTKVVKNGQPQMTANWWPIFFFLHWNKKGKKYLKNERWGKKRWAFSCAFILLLFLPI